jgi:solute carrier family 25 oxoglutarate transporter 11
MNIYRVFSEMSVADATSSILQQALTRTVTEEGAGALYKGLMPNILRGMSMNVGMLACYDQAKEGVAAILNDPMTNGPALTTQIGASCVAVSISTFFTC